MTETVYTVHTATGTVCVDRETAEQYSRNGTKVTARTTVRG